MILRHRRQAHLSTTLLKFLRCLDRAGHPTPLIRTTPLRSIALGVVGAVLKVGATGRFDLPSGYQGLHGFRNRALERQILLGMLGQQPGRVRPVLAHLRHGRPAMGRNDRLQPSGVYRIDSTEHPLLTLGGQREVPHRLIGILHPQEWTGQPFVDIRLP